MLIELFSKPLDKRTLEELGERLRDVIYQQGTLKRGITDAQGKQREMLSFVVDRLGEFAESTGVYNTKISTFTEWVGSALSLPELSGLIDEIVRETRAIGHRTQQSQAGLQHLREAVDLANREIERLEAELETASEMVGHNALTGALNRKGLDEMLTRRFLMHENQKLLITFSAGVAEVATPDEPVQQVIDRADQAMYRAKKAGKNRVEAS